MLPNFLVAGVAKAGTTSLYYYLNQHPEVDIPRKESFFFARHFYKNAGGENPPYFRDKSRIIFTDEEYEKFYAGCHKKAIGEVSTCYAYLHESAIPLIKKKSGNIKIIFILRNPVERAFSAYKHFIRSGDETLSFEEALDAERSRIEKHWDFMWYYTDVGFYAKQVKAFKDNFSEVKVFLSEDLVSNPQKTMKELFHFIGVDENFTPDTDFRYNASNTATPPLLDHSIKKNQLTKFLKPFIKKIIPEKKRMELKQRLRTSIGTDQQQMNENVRTQLVQLYHDDINELEKIIDRDLSAWRK